MFKFILRETASLIALAIFIANLTAWLAIYADVCHK